LLPCFKALSSRRLACTLSLGCGSLRHPRYIVRVAASLGTLSTRHSRTCLGSGSWPLLLSHPRLLVVLSHPRFRCASDSVCCTHLRLTPGRSRAGSFLHPWPACLALPRRHVVGSFRSWLCTPPITLAGCYSGARARHRLVLVHASHVVCQMIRLLFVSWPVVAASVGPSWHGVWTPRRCRAAILGNHSMGPCPRVSRSPARRPRAWGSAGVRGGSGIASPAYRQRRFR
jgi:hypothetical protein